MPADARLEFGPHEWSLAYRVALRVLRAPDQAEDAAQEALLHAYNARHTFNGLARPDSWLYRIAYNTALSHLRRPFRQRYLDGDVITLLDDDNVSERSPETSAIARQLAGNLEGCMSKMPCADRLAFTERFLLGTSERELGDILGVSTNAAKQRAFRARRAVQSCMRARELESKR